MTRPRIHQIATACCMCAAVALDVVSLAQAQMKPSAVLDNPVAALSLDKLSATRERPLFSPSRHAPRPPIVASVRASVEVLPPPSIELHGTIINADDALAVIVSRADNQTMRLRLGDEIGGWKVVVIDQRKLVLSRDERVAEFTIFAGKSAVGQQQQQDRQSHSQPQPTAPLDPGGVNSDNRPDDLVTQD